MFHSFQIGSFDICWANVLMNLNNLLCVKINFNDICLEKKIHVNLEVVSLIIFE